MDKPAAPINRHKARAEAGDKTFGVKPFPGSGPKPKRIGVTNDRFNRDGKL